MKKIAQLLSLVALLISSAQSNAQQVATIGIGDITLTADASAELRSTESILSAVADSINSRLIETRKFTVLDYSQLRSRIEEQDRNLIDFYFKQYSGNAILQAGLDYILNASITEFSLVKPEVSKTDNLAAMINLEFELIGVADATVGIGSKVIAKVYAPLSVGDVAAAQQLLDSAIKQASMQLVDQVIANLFPIRVMKIITYDEGSEKFERYKISEDTEGALITLNYGKGIFTVGDIVMVYPVDSGITVDEFGQPIGDVIASLKIISTETRFSTAQAITGHKKLKQGQKAQLILIGG